MYHIKIASIVMLLLASSCVVFAEPAEKADEKPVVLPDGVIGMCLKAGGRKEAFVAETLLSTVNVNDPLVTLKKGSAAAIIEATPENLKILAAKPEAIKAFTDAGGWLMLWGVTPESLADFNKIVGVKHILRPFEMEEIDLPLKKDPLVRGVKRSRLFMVTGASSGGVVPVPLRVDDAWSYVVDFDDIAPFCKFPPAKYWSAEPEQAVPGQPHYPRSMVNGLTYQWRWAFLFRLDNKEPTKWTIDLPREEQLEQFSIHPLMNFHRITELTLTYGDEKAKPVVLKINEADERQDIKIPLRKTKKLTIEITKWRKVGKAANTLGIMNMWIKPKRSKEFYAKVKPLLTLGVLVKYPMGAEEEVKEGEVKDGEVKDGEVKDGEVKKGGIMLNQLNIVDIEASARNRTYKRDIFNKLVENMLKN